MYWYGYGSLGSSPKSVMKSRKASGQAGGTGGKASVGIFGHFELASLLVQHPAFLPVFEIHVLRQYQPNSGQLQVPG